MHNWHVQSQVRCHTWPSRHTWASTIPGPGMLHMTEDTNNQFSCKSRSLPSLGLSFVSECFLHTPYTSTFALNRDILDWDFMKVGSTHVSKSGRGCSWGIWGRPVHHLPPWARLTLPCPALLGLEGPEENTIFSVNLRLPLLKAGEILGHGINQNQDKLYRNLSNMIPRQTGDAQHTHIRKKKKAHNT